MSISLKALINEMSEFIIDVLVEEITYLEEIRHSIIRCR